MRHEVSFPADALISAKPNLWTREFRVSPCRAGWLRHTSGLRDLRMSNPDGVYGDMRDGTPHALEVHDLRVHFQVHDGTLPAVDGVSFTLERGRTLGVVGESGSGKTVSALAILRLLETPPADFKSGRIMFGGRDILKLSDAEISSVRGKEIAMIFQEPMTALNPVRTVGFQVAEPLVRHLGLSATEARQRATKLFELVGISGPAETIDRYPHELSGGMRQRVMIAMAIACEPNVLIADEPTTALDVTIQAQILDLIVGLQERFGTAILLITHDLAVIAETAHRVAVMYAGRIVELAPVATMFEAPRHPYTQGLLRSIPQIVRNRPSRLNEIAGTVPNLAQLGPGCAFASRCPRVIDQCRLKAPPLEDRSSGHSVACWRAADA
jgi:peptide/nickel transport system ATP-binding protein